MTKAQAIRFIEQWQPLLAPEWDVKIVDGPEPSAAATEHGAAIVTEGDYLRATLYLHEVIANGTPDKDAKAALLHELLHLTFDDIEAAARTPFATLGVPASTLANVNLERALERTVDRLASAFESLTD